MKTFLLSCIAFSLFIMMNNNNIAVNASEGRLFNEFSQYVDEADLSIEENNENNELNIAKYNDYVNNKVNMTKCQSPFHDYSNNNNGEITFGFDAMNQKYIPGDRRKDKNKLRVVSFNAEWLFLEEYNGCIGDKCKWFNTESAKKHFKAISDVTRKLNGDIVNFIEVRGCTELEYMTELLDTKIYKHYLLPGTDIATGQNVGLISKIDPMKLERTDVKIEFPIKDSSCPGKSKYTDRKSVSKHFFTKMEFNGLKVVVGAAHLLAYPDNNDRCFQREAQALSLRTRIEEYISDGYEVIFTGDMNDFDGSILDRNSNKPISGVLDIIKGVGRGNPKNQLISVSEFIPKEKRYSDWWDKNKNCKMTMNEVSMIDHILFSPGLKKFFKSGFVAHDSFKMGCNDFSDHWPVVADFDFTMGSPISSPE